MKDWYANATKPQKIFLWVIAILIALFVGGSMYAGDVAMAAALVPLGLLIYLQLGNGKGQPEKSAKQDGQN